MIGEHTGIRDSVCGGDEHQALHPIQDGKVIKEGSRAATGGIHFDGIRDGVDSISKNGFLVILIRHCILALCATYTIDKLIGLNQEFFSH